MLRPTLTGPAAVPPNLVASISPATTSQSSPGAVVLTASATGGTGAQSWAWVATYADGTSAAALLSGSGASRTLTTTTPGQSVRVVATATDAVGQTSAASALVLVEQPAAPTLSGPAPSAIDAPGSASVTFTGATGYGALSYSATLSKPSGSAATLSGSGLGAYTFTTDVEGAYAVTLTQTDALGRTAAATGIVSLVSAGSIWTQFFSEDFTTYDAASRSGNGTLALQKAGVTQYTGTLSLSSGTGSAGIDASGMFITIATGTGQACFTIAPTVDTSKWWAFQWLMDIPTLTGNSVSCGPTLNNTTTVNSGTEIFPLMVFNNATSGYDLKTGIRLSGVGQGATDFATGLANPGRVCATLVMRGRLAHSLVHDSDTFIPMANIDDSPILYALDSSSADPTPSRTAPWVSTPKVGVRIGSAAGTARIRALRILSASPRSN